MSTVKISELPVIPVLNHDTSQTLFPAVDVVTNITGRLTAKVLAEHLYSNDVLNVGNTAVILPNVVAQLASTSDNYIQVNLQNSSGNGSADYVITADTGTDSTYYIDMGYNGSTYNYDGYTYAKPLDGYLIVQGGDNLSPGGNLVIGTTTPGKDVSILVGSIDESKIMAKFVANTGFKMVEYPIAFADGSTQNTAASSSTHTGVIFGKSNASFIAANSAGVYANAAYVKANAAGSYANSAFAAANAAADLVVTALSNASDAGGKATAAFIAANTGINNASGASNYANGAFLKANNALANTTGVFGGSLTIANNLTVNGSVTFANIAFSATDAVVTISAANNGLHQVSGGDGYVLHMTGKHDVPTRIVGDSFGANGQSTFVLFGGRAARGNVEYPTAVQTNDVLTRFAGSSYGSTKYQTGGVARIDIVATENHTDTERGTAIKLYNVQEGSNALSHIATFNANSAVVTGVINPQKGFVYSPNNITTPSTAYSLDFQRDSMIRMTVNDNSTITLSNYQTGKIVEVWITNTAAQNKTVTHGCLANNSTVRSTSFTVLANACAFLKYFSINGDQANTYVSITS